MGTPNILFYSILFKCNRSQLNSFGDKKVGYRTQYLHYALSNAVSIKNSQST
jgi:hypothetical protein